jgi:hypothetical protein
MMVVPRIVRPKSRGHLRLTGPNPLDPIEIHANILGDPGDLKAVTTAKELCRDIADYKIFHPFLKREITPGSLKGPALEQIVRNSVSAIGTRAVRPRWDAIPCRSSMVISRSMGLKTFVSRTGSYAAHINRQHNGALRRHRRTLRRDTEDLTGRQGHAGRIEAASAKTFA